MCGKETLFMQIRFTMCGKETLFISPRDSEGYYLGEKMIEKGLYYSNQSFANMIKSVGGKWEDTKKRPIVCLIKSNEHDRMYWAIPMGKWNHRDLDQKQRIPGNAFTAP